MTESSKTEQRILDFVNKHFPLARKVGLKPRDKWLETGLLDSLGILDLIHFLEEEFSIQVLDEELGPENFESLSTVVDFTTRKMASADRTQGTPCN